MTDSHERSILDELWREGKWGSFDERGNKVR
jgi:hypothetical protein